MLRFKRILFFLLALLALLCGVLAFFEDAIEDELDVFSDARFACIHKKQLVCVCVCSKDDNIKHVRNILVGPRLETGVSVRVSVTS